MLNEAVPFFLCLLDLTTSAQADMNNQLYATAFDTSGTMTLVEDRIANERNNGLAVRHSQKKN